MSREKKRSPQTTRKLLFSVKIDDCRVEYIASTGGAGGQNKNRRHTACRITHPPSGAVGFSADEREQGQNRRVAFRRMAESREFQAWNQRVAAELISGKSIDERVEEAMRPENLKVETRKDNKWQEIDECDCMDCSIAGEPTH